MTVEAIGLAFAGLALGVLLGWLLGGRRVQGVSVALAGAEERARTADGLRETLARLEADLGAVRHERHELDKQLAEARAQHDNIRQLRDGLREERDAARDQHSEASNECSRLNSLIVGLEKEKEKDREANERLLAELRDVQDKLPVLFQNAAQATLDQAQRKFLERAQERFAQSEDTAKQALGALLQPVHERLTKYEDAVGKVEAERREAFGLLSGQITAMREDANRVSSQAANLVNALRNAPKARGRWGEQQLRNVLESCGLSEHTDFATEVSVEAEGGRLRPDAVVKVPGGKALVIDAKVSLNAYQDAFNAVDEAGREAGLNAHAASMRAHVNGLGNKAYWNQFEDTPDYVIMFVPGEHFLSAALEHDAGLWDYAFERRVLLATPTNLVAIARTVAAVWRQEKLAKEARQIGVLGKEMYERLGVVAEHLAKAGDSLNRTVGHFNKATNSFNTRLVTTGKRFRELNIDTGAKELDDVGGIEGLATHIEERALPAPSTAAALI